MDERKYKFLKDLTWDEIIILKEEMEVELAGRKDIRFKELVQNFCDAWEALRSEFPTVEVHDCCGYCPQCDEWHAMRLDSDQVFVPEDFSR